MGLCFRHREEEPGRGLDGNVRTDVGAPVLTQEGLGERAADLLARPAERQRGRLVAARPQPGLGKLAGQGRTMAEGAVKKRQH